MEKLLVLSDIHGGIRRAAEAVAMHGECTGIIFLGDGARHVEYLQSLAPHSAFIAVKGNCDTALDGISREEAVFECAGHRLLCCHGHRYGVKSGVGAYLAAAKRVGADIALFGHTHLPHEEYDSDSGIYLFNPGSIGSPRAGKPTYGLLTLSGGNVLFSLGEVE